MNEENKGQEGCCEEKGGFFKGVAIFAFFLALAVGYYLSLDYALMVHAQNLPFPYK